MAESTDTTNLGFAALATGETVTLVQGSPDAGAEQEPMSSGGLIYTERDRPTIEQVLADSGVISYTWEPEIIKVASATRTTPVVVCAAISGAISAAGGVLFVASTVTGHLRMNPILALMMFFGGLVLAATVLSAAHASAAIESDSMHGETSELLPSQPSAKDERRSITYREAHVLDLVRLGYTSKSQLAKQLGSETRVSVAESLRDLEHMAAMLRKFGSAYRTEGADDEWESESRSSGNRPAK